jgi:hypothetical protein
MTRDDVMRLSGRELDEAVTALVFGLRVVECDPVDGRYGPYTVREGHWTRVNGETYPLLDLLPEYSTDIAAAWEAVETATNHRPDEEFVLVRLRDGRWFASWFDGYLDVGAGIIDGYLDDGVIAVDANPATAASRAMLLSALKRSEAKNGGGEA